MNKETVSLIKQRLLKVNAGLILFFLFAATVAFHEVALRVIDEDDDLNAVFGGSQLGFDAHQCIVSVQLRLEEHAVAVLDVAYLFVGEGATAQADGVDAYIGKRIASGLDIGRNVLTDQ